MTADPHGPAAPPTRPGRRRLSPERIVTTAAELIDEQGLPALTMRSLAMRLEADPSAVYRHFRNKDELLGQVADAFLAELAPDPDREGTGTLDWQQAAREMAGRIRGLLRRQPGLLPVITSAPVTAGTVRFTASLLREFQAAGLSRPRAQQALSTLLAFILGFAALETGQPAPGIPRAAGRPAVTGSNVALTSEFWWPAPEALDARFTEGLDMILSAVAAGDDHPRAPSGGSPPGLPLTASPPSGDVAENA